MHNKSERKRIIPITKKLFSYIHKTDNKIKKNKINSKFCKLIFQLALTRSEENHSKNGSNLKSESSPFMSHENKLLFCPKIKCIISWTPN